MFKIYHVLYYLLVIIYILHLKSTIVRSTYCMLIHEHDIFYIDLIMIKLVSLESLFI